MVVIRVLVAGKGVVVISRKSESLSDAQDWLERHSWNVEEAVFKWGAKQAETGA